MKTSRCFVAIFNKKGDCYQVALDQNGQRAVIDILSQYHDGKIKVLKDKLPISMTDPKPVKNEQKQG
jgi:hypothetical protein